MKTVHRTMMILAVAALLAIASAAPSRKTQKAGVRTKIYIRRTRTTKGTFSISLPSHEKKATVKTRRASEKALKSSRERMEAGKRVVRESIRVKWPGPSKPARVKPPKVLPVPPKPPSKPVPPRVSPWPGPKPKPKPPIRRIVPKVPEPPRRIKKVIRKPRLPIKLPPELPVHPIRRPKPVPPVKPSPKPSPQPKPSKAGGGGGGKGGGQQQSRQARPVPAPGVPETALMGLAALLALVVIDAFRRRR